MTITRRWRHRRRESRCQRQLSDVRCLCLFIGHGRSGHSLIGHLLNQHPNAAISHEYHLLLQMILFPDHPYTHFRLMRNKARKTKGRKFRYNGYSYQRLRNTKAKGEEIMLLGDKSGGTTADMLHKYGLDILRPLEKIDVALRFLCIIRNPYDVIFTRTMREVFMRHSPLFRRYGKNRLDLDAVAKALDGDAECRRQLPLELKRNVKVYFRRAEAIQSLIDAERHPMLVTHYREYTANPRAQMENILDFLQLPRIEGYADEAALQVRAASRSRDKSEALWTDEIIADIQSQARRYNYLDGYSFTSD